jgi:hypothetical protein
MRNYRRIIGAFIIAAAMSTAVVKADDGAPGGPNRGTCGFLMGILYKVGSPLVVQAVFERVFDCDFDG